jgi:hypothetical protein
MDDQSGWLVDHHEVIVFEENRERHLLRFGGGANGRRDIDLGVLSFRDA